MTDQDWSTLRETYACYETEAVLVLNKPPGISVMGERHETDLVRIAKDAGEELFPVHRIDKVTSGAILFAKDMRVHPDLTRQFAKRTVKKSYLAIVSPGGLPERGTIELPLSVGRKNRVRIAAERGDIRHDGDAWTVPAEAVFRHVRTYPSTTEFARRWGDDDEAVLVVDPRTGRRHQIRVHLAWIGHAIVGDPLFGGKGGRTHLHSWRLEFDLGGERIAVEAPPDDGFWEPARGRTT
ncbi:RluA family pseudouridine synthase [Fodinicola acaciae]|uniref:RluA family pseudouridine synthase n=1 Tax=Fodinicola acaciae TaxID=2681555 RepID=UPI0013D63FD0|nr:RNA pseudouridine synthase [Fodinicola acaciae]